MYYDVHNIFNNLSCKFLLTSEDPLFPVFTISLRHILMDCDGLNSSWTRLIHMKIFLMKSGQS